MVLFTNVSIVAVLAAIIVAQVIKYPIALIFNRQKAKLSIVHATGGMPSSHSAAATALITSLIFQYGYLDPVVATAVCFGLIVMFDAMGVRRQSGEQGKAMRDLLKLLEEEAKRSDRPELEKALNHFGKENRVIDDYLGHKPSEVLGGVVTGLLVTFVVYMLYSYVMLRVG